jgi:hypothetical protein
MDGRANAGHQLRLGLCDPHIVRASEFQHPVQGGSSDGDFRGLSLVSTRSKGIADHTFVSTNCCLDLGPKIVATCLLPAIRPRSAISSMCRSRCVGAVVAKALGTAVARGGTMTAASHGRPRRPPADGPTTPHRGAPPRPRPVRGPRRAPPRLGPAARHLATWSTSITPPCDPVSPSRNALKQSFKSTPKASFAK